MGWKRHIKNLLNFILRPYNYELAISSLLYEWQKSPFIKPACNKDVLPEGAENYLHKENPRLKALRKEYSRFNLTIMKPVIWIDGYLKTEDLRCFRAHNPFLYQTGRRNDNILSYALTAYYIKTIDKSNFLEKLKEDGYFGAITFLVDNKLVSRDLLDSINEIYFLEKNLNISRQENLNILDIGAGYGRLAHRMIEALPNIQHYYCVDATPEATFCCEYYLRFRNVHSKAITVPVYEIEHLLTIQPINIAVNISSFSECSISAIEWWISLLQKNRVRYLVIVFDTEKLLLASDRKDFSNIIEKHNYKLIAREPKYRDAVIQKYGIYKTYYHLFELS